MNDVTSNSAAFDSPKVGSFYGRLRKEFPSQIIVDTTEVCSLGCVHCPHPDFGDARHSVETLS